MIAFAAWCLWPHVDLVSTFSECVTRNLHSAHEASYNCITLS